jgi:Nucleoside-diphosphate-sugar epimerases
MEGKRYLVTGGFGFMGAWVVRRLALAGHELHVLSRSAEGKRFVSPLAASPGTASGASSGAFPPSQADFAAPAFVQADLVHDSPARIAACLPEGLEGIVHAAGYTGAEGRESLLVNALGTRNLLEAVRLYALERPHQPCPVVVYASTFHVYGAISGHIDEGTECRPKTDYALTHLLAEDYCRFYARERGVPALAFRCANGFGAPCCLPFAHWSLLVHDLCKTAVEQGELVLRSPPDIRRSFIAMSEVARAVEALLAHSGQAWGHGLFNLGGQDMTLGEMAAMVAREASNLLGRNIPLRCLSDPAGAMPGLVLDSSRLQELAGFTLRQDIQAEIRAILAFLTRKGERP